MKRRLKVTMHPQNLQHWSRYEVKAHTERPFKTNPLRACKSRHQVFSAAYPIRMPGSVSVPVSRSKEVYAVRDEMNAGMEPNVSTSRHIVNHRYDLSRCASTAAIEGNYTL